MNKFQDLVYDVSNFHEYKEVILIQLCINDLIKTPLKINKELGRGLAFNRHYYTELLLILLAIILLVSGNTHISNTINFANCYCLYF